MGLPVADTGKVLAVNPSSRNLFIFILKFGDVGELFREFRAIQASFGGDGSTASRWDSGRLY